MYPNHSIKYGSNHILNNNKYNIDQIENTYGIVKLVK
jgi:hypothetical protein